MDEISIEKEELPTRSGEVMDEIPVEIAEVPTTSGKVMDEISITQRELPKKSGEDTGEITIENGKLPTRSAEVADEISTENEELPTRSGADIDEISIQNGELPTRSGKVPNEISGKIPKETENGELPTRSDEDMVEIAIENGELSTTSPDSAGTRIKKKYPSFWTNLSEYFTDYTRLTTLDAFPYMGDQSRSLAERLFWFVLMSLSIYAGTLQIIDAYDKWTTSPVIVSFAQNSIPVHSIPFPAVTICSETKSKQRIFNFTEVYHKIKSDGGGNVTLSEREELENMALLCDHHLYPFGGLTTNVNVTDFLAEVAPTFSEAIWQCKWTNVNESCDHMFTTSLTDEGICFTANMLDWDEIYTNEVFHDTEFQRHGRDSWGWTLENGYLPGTGSNTFPRRALSAGAKAGFTILLRAFEQDLDYLCRGPVQGFKVLLHHPGEVPRVSMQFYRVPLDQEVIVTIKPEMMRASPNLRGYDPLKRGCYFEGERHLRFFKKYTAQSCQVECLTNLTLHLCKCVAFHMPHAEATEICGSGSIKCMQDAQVKMLSGEHGDCGCLSACTSLTYNTEISQADFDWVELFQAFKQNFSEFPGIRMARINMYFKEMQFITSERSELYGVADFLANCGGLMGFFTGCSYISFIEIVHFLSLRLFFNLYSFGLHYWSGSEKLLNDASYDH